MYPKYWNPGTSVGPARVNMPEGDSPACLHVRTAAAGVRDGEVSKALGNAPHAWPEAEQMLVEAATQKEAQQHCVGLKAWPVAGCAVKLAQNECAAALRRKAVLKIYNSYINMRPRKRAWSAAAGRPGENVQIPRKSLSNCGLTSRALSITISCSARMAALPGSAYRCIHRI